MLYPPVLCHEMFLSDDGNDRPEHSRVETIPYLREVDEAEGDHKVEEGQRAIQV